MDLPSDWRAMARLGTRKRERASMTKSHPPIGDRWMGMGFAKARRRGEREGMCGGREAQGGGAELEVEVEKVQVCRWGGIGQNPHADWPGGAGELPSVKTATTRDGPFLRDGHLSSLLRGTPFETYIYWILFEWT